MAIQLCKIEVDFTDFDGTPDSHPCGRKADIAAVIRHEGAWGVTFGAWEFCTEHAEDLHFGQVVEAPGLFRDTVLAVAIR